MLLPLCTGTYCYMIPTLASHLYFLAQSLYTSESNFAITITFFYIEWVETRTRSSCRNASTQLDTVMLQHMEFQQFTSPWSGLPSSEYGNTCYHAKKRCVELKWGQNFTISILESLALASRQKAQLHEEFGV